MVAAVSRPNGFAARQLAKSDCEMFAPAFLTEELEDHMEEITARAGLSGAEWATRLAAALRPIRLVPEKELIRCDDHVLVARARAVDPDDAPYLAAFVATRADLLWTRDKRLLAAFPGIAVSIVPPGYAWRMERKAPREDSEKTKRARPRAGAGIGQS